MTRDVLGREIAVGDRVLWAGGRGQTDTFSEGPLTVEKITEAGNLIVLRPGHRHRTTLNPNRVVRIEPDDGRPMPTDLFLVKLLEAKLDHYDTRECLQAWVEGAWEEAMDFER